MVEASWGYLPTAFLLGALHSFEPAHGKAVLAAYLTGGKRRLVDAVLFGLLVAVAHTLSIMALGVCAWIAADYYRLEVTRPVVSLIGGLLVLGVGFWMLVRWRTGSCDHPGHGHHDHGTSGAQAGRNGASGKSLGQLALIGFGGGLVPCPAGVAMLMTAVASGDLTQGLSLAAAFSSGAGGVVVLLSVLIQRASGLATRYAVPQSRLVEYLPLAASLVVITVGMWLGATAFLDVVGEDSF